MEGIALIFVIERNEFVLRSLAGKQKGVAMNIVYDSDSYAIVAYPVRQGFELVDKLGNRSLFVQGSVALSLREAIDSIPFENRDEESIDSLLDDYCVGAAHRFPLTAVAHFGARRDGSVYELSGSTTRLIAGSSWCGWVVKPRLVIRRNILLFSVSTSPITAL